MLIDALETCAFAYRTAGFFARGVAPTPSDVIKRAIGLPVPHDKPDGLPSGCGRIPKSAKPGSSGDATVSICISSFDFARWVGRQDRGCAGHCIPNGNGTGNRMGLRPASTAMLLKVLCRSRLAVRRIRAAWGLFGPLQYAGNRLANVLHMGRLQPVVPLPNIGKRAVFGAASG